MPENDPVVNNDPTNNNQNNIDWKQSIPEEFKSHKSLENVPDIPTLVKNYVNAQSMIGQSIRLPKDDAKPEEWDAFYAKMGRPATAKDYAAKMPEGIKAEETEFNGFLEAAHKMGMNKSQVQGMLDWYGKSVSSMTENQTAALVAAKEESANALQKEWGANFPKNLALAKRALDNIGDDSVKQMFETSGLGNHVGFVKMLAQVGELLAESGLIGGKVDGVLDSNQAIAEISVIRGNREHAYHNPSAPGHKEAIERMQQLYQLAYPR